MRKLIAAAALAGALSAAGPAAPARADHAGHPFCGSGTQYAQEHVVPLAQAASLGPAHGHTPGFHQGFSVCLPLPTHPDA